MVRRPPISTRTYTLLPDTTLVRSFIKALSFGVDFQRDVGSNARFDMIFEHKLAETGETQTGKLLYAGLDRGNKKLQMMRWTLGGREQFFDAGGEATQKGLMRTPVDGARLTRSEEHTSELQSLMRTSYAVFGLKKKKHITKT